MKSPEKIVHQTQIPNTTTNSIISLHNIKTYDSWQFQTQSSNTSNKFEECDFETAGYRQWAANEQWAKERTALCIGIQKKFYSIYIIQFIVQL